MHGTMLTFSTSFAFLATTSICIFHATATRIIDTKRFFLIIVRVLDILVVGGVYLYLCFFCGSALFFCLEISQFMTYVSMY